MPRWSCGHRPISQPADFGEFKEYITVRPSSLLRIREPDERETAFAELVQDLKPAKKMSAPPR
jgi:DNA polymerase